MARSELEDAGRLKWYECQMAVDGKMRYKLPLSASIPLIQTQIALSQCARSAGGAAAQAGCSMEAYLTPGSCLYYQCFQEHALARCAASNMLTTDSQEKYFAGEEAECARRFKWDMTDMNGCAFSHPHMSPCVQMPGVGHAAGTCPYVPPSGLTKLQLAGIIVAACSLAIVALSMTVGQCFYRNAKRGAKAETSRLLEEEGGQPLDGSQGGPYRVENPAYAEHLSSPGRAIGDRRSQRGNRARMSTGGSSMHGSGSEGSQSDDYRGGGEERFEVGAGRGALGHTLRTPPRSGWAAPAPSGIGSLQGGASRQQGRAGAVPGAG